MSTAAVTDRTPISAQCLAATSPSQAKAFERIYGGQPEASTGLPLSVLDAALPASPLMDHVACPIDGSNGAAVTHL